MTAKNFYDAVLIGLDLRTLLAGALLAKRGFRVMVVGQGQPWPSYEARGVSFPRAPFSLTSHESPVLARVFSEIAVRPLVQRRTRPLAPALQVALPTHRFDLSSAPEFVAGEVRREFPDARRFAEALWQKAEQASTRLDRLVARDLMWPPDTFFERREFARATLEQPFGDFTAPGPTHALPPEHAFMRVLDGCAAFADGSPNVERNDARSLRILAGRLRAAELAEGGLAGLFELLIENIRSHNGSLRLNERVDALSMRRDTLTGLHLLPSDEEVGCHFMLWGLPVARLGSLLADRNMLDPLFEESGEPRVRHHRYTLNLLLRGEAVPEGMGRDVLLLGSEPMWVQCQRLASGERALMSVEALLPAEAADARARRLAGQRERMLRALGELSPFLGEHLELIDSPHDGRPAQDVRGAGSFEPGAPFTRGPETMRAMYAFPRTRVHGAAALTVRTPLKRVLLCNDQVVPGFGLEGAFLTAWSAARVVTRALQRSWMNRGRWTKVEL